MKITPFFTIITPTYNRAKFLKIAISSVLAQSFNDWELVVRQQSRPAGGSWNDTGQGNMIAVFSGSSGADIGVTRDVPCPVLKRETRLELEETEGNDTIVVDIEVVEIDELSGTP